MAGDPFEAVIAAAGALPADAEQMPVQVLDQRMRQLARARAMLDAALAEQLAVFDARGGAQQHGHTSTRAWLSAQLRLGHEAGLLLKVARRLPQLPQLDKAFTAGEITLEHAGAAAWLSSRIDARELGEYEPILLDLAHQSPPGQLHTACRHLFHLLDPDQGDHDAATAHRKRSLSAGRTIDGMVHLHGVLDPTGGDVLLSALDAATPAPAEYEPRTADQRRADALEDICAAWLATAPTCGGLPAQVHLTMSLRSLQQTPTTTNGDDSSSGGRDGGGEVPYGQLAGDVPTLTDTHPTAASNARRLACDAGLIPTVLGSHHEPLDIGRHTRTIPTGLRRALHHRDRGCRFPGCDRPPAWCDGHHIQPWYHDGPTNLDNLILTCRYHHTLIHQGWQLTGHPNHTIHFTPPERTQTNLTSQPRNQPPRGP